MTTATINGKTYTVETVDAEQGAYLFNGPRGQQFGSFRDPQNGLLQIVNTRNWKGVPGWFTVRNGTIEQA